MPRCECGAEATLTLISRAKADSTTYYACRECGGGSSVRDAFWVDPIPNAPERAMMRLEAEAEAVLGADHVAALKAASQLAERTTTCGTH